MNNILIILLLLPLCLKCQYLTGLKYFKEHKFQYALYFFNKEIQYDSNDSIKANTYHYIGSIYYEQHKYDLAIEYFNNAYIIYDKLNNLSMISAELNNIGIIYSSLNNKKALLFFNKALTIDEKQYNIWNNIGYYYYNIKNYDSAIYYYNKALIDTNLTALINGNLGDIYYDLHNYNKALKHYTIQITLDSINNNTYNILSTNINISKLYVSIDSIVKAKRVLNTSIILNKQLNDNDISLDMYNIFCNIYKKENKLDSFLYYKDKIYELKDTISLYNNDLKLKESIEHFDIKYKVKEKDIIIELHKQKTLKYKIGFICVFIIVLLLITIVHFILKHKNKILKYTKYIENINKEINESVNYAKELQIGLMSSSSDLLHRDNSSIIYQPKDIVSGDFYFYKKYDNLEVIAIADCTGHGIPGAIMTAICYNVLINVMTLNNIQILGFNELVSLVSDQVYNAFSHEKREVLKDGMDLSISLYNNDTKELLHVGANNPLWLVRKGFTEIENSELFLSDKQYHLWQFKGTKNYIGAHNAHFNINKIQLQEDDNIFMFTDGLQDQFGGINNKKLKSNKIAKTILNSINITNDIKSTINNLSLLLHTHKENYDQTDDITFFGFKI